MSKARASTAETSKPTEEAAREGNKRKDKKTTARVLGRSSIMRDLEEDEEEEDAAPAPSPRSSWGMPLSQGLPLQIPRLPPRLLLKLRSLLRPREAPGTYQLKKRTRPQCQRWNKKMMKP